MRCVRRERAEQEQHVARIDLAQPLPHALAALEVQHRPPPRLAVQLEEPLGPERRLPQQVVHVEVRPAARAAARGRISSK